MSDEKKTEEKKQERTRGDRGELGKATAGLTMKQRWHEANFKRVDADNKRNPGKRIYVRNPGAVSLKAFARALAKEGDAVAKEWLANKLGAKNQGRSDANIKAARETSQATKAAKKSKGKK